jgi:hypothetical protein
MAGFTKSYRDKWIHPIFRDLLEASVWAWMCDTAVWEDTRINYCGQVISLSRGQLITSRSFISNGFRVGEQSIRTLLARLENDGMINQRPTSHGTIITFCNYSKYQDYQPAPNQQSNQPLTSAQPAPNQNKKELKEGKELKKETYSAEFEQFWKLYPKKDDKSQAAKAYIKARKETDHAKIIDGVERYAAAKPWGDNIRFCKNASTWLNGKCWENEYTVGGFADQNSGGVGKNTPTSYERSIMAAYAHGRADEV